MKYLIQRIGPLDKNVFNKTCLLKDIYCEFQLFNEKEIHKTGVIKQSVNVSINFSKQFSLVATKEVVLLIK